MSNLHQRSARSSTSVAHSAPTGPSLWPTVADGTSPAATSKSRWRFFGILILVPLVCLSLGYYFLTRPFNISPSLATSLPPGRISTLTPSANIQRVLTVSVKGDPNRVAGPAFAQLFRAYYSMAGVNKFTAPPVTRARWPHDTLTHSKDDWTGKYALPIPPEATLPESADLAAHGGDPSSIPHIETWNYGTSGIVGEIVHIGPYDRESDTIAQLMRLIREQGYKINMAVEHEEEYLHTRGMISFLSPDPKDYVTVIRYGLEKESNLKV